MANVELSCPTYDTEAEIPALVDGQIAYAVDTRKWFKAEVTAGGVPTDADYLVGTANGDLSAEIVVGATPGGELGGTWGAPTVDATHSGSTHAATQAAAEATAAADATTKADAAEAAAIAASEPVGSVAAHAGAADPHTEYQRESEKGAANGYASLGADSLVPQDQLGTGTQDGTKFLRDDGTWQTAPGEGGGDAKLESWPVGSVFISVVSTSPATLLGGGTWSQIAAGRVLVGIDSGDTDFDAAEETGGAKTVTLDETMIPAHTHVENAPSSASGGALKFAVDTNASGTQDSGLSTASTGGGGAHANVQPYFVVYMWKRTA